VRFEKSNDVLGTTNRGNPAESEPVHPLPGRLHGQMRNLAVEPGGPQASLSEKFRHRDGRRQQHDPRGVSYNALRIQGYAYGAHGLAKGLSNDPDDCIFPNVSLETEFGNEIKTKARIPLMTGALGSTFMAAKYWDSFAIGGALVGIPVVIGENVVGVDRESKIGGGKTARAKSKRPGTGTPHRRLPALL
jgi:hypothetical protein